MFTRTHYSTQGVVSTKRVDNMTTKELVLELRARINPSTGSVYTLSEIASLVGASPGWAHHILRGSENHVPPRASKYLPPLRKLVSRRRVEDEKGTLIDSETPAVTKIVGRRRVRTDIGVREPVEEKVIEPVQAVEVVETEAEAQEPAEASKELSAPEFFPVLDQVREDLWNMTVALDSLTQEQLLLLHESSHPLFRSTIQGLRGDVEGVRDSLLRIVEKIEGRL